MARRRGEWDFYPTAISGAHASVWLDLQYRHTAKPPRATTHYWFRIAMRDVADHAMGSQAEAEALWPLEETIRTAAARRALRYVGRVRTGGIWHMSFYGPPNKRHLLERVVVALDFGGRATTLGAEVDPTWAFYRELLLPDDERAAWMKDRRVVETLEEHGDDPTTPRRIDHWAYFPSRPCRRAFLDAALALGFTHDEATEPATKPGAHAARVFRIEPTTLDSIHATTEALRHLASTHRGTYDGWETQVTTRERRR